MLRDAAFSACCFLRDLAPDPAILVVRALAVGVDNNRELGAAYGNFERRACFSPPPASPPSQRSARSLGIRACGLPAGLPGVAVKAALAEVFALPVLALVVQEPVKVLDPGVVKIFLPFQLAAG